MTTYIHRSRFVLGLALIASTLFPTTGAAQEAKAASVAQPAGIAAPDRKGYATANGVNYYYEIRGRGEPLLLLHGGLGAIEMFGPVLGMLSAKRQVIAVDLHGHGRTALGSRPIDLKAQGDDMAELLRQLGYRQVDAVGYSLGAGVAMRLAVQHPARVRRLALVSGAHTTDAFFPEMRPVQAQLGAAMADMMKDTPMYATYKALAPKLEDFPRLLDELGRLMRTDYDWSEDVKTLTMPVMLVWGDADMYQPEYMVRFYKLLGGGQKDGGWMRENVSRHRLAILPGLTHYEIFMAPQLAHTVIPFLDGVSNAPSWANQVKQED